jgi:hypothetical protein
MRRHIRSAVVGAAVLAFVAAGAVRAQEVPLPGIDNTAFGTTTAEFLLLGAGARGAALGNNFAAITTDVTALYWNPAGVAEMTRPGVSVSTYTYIADTRYNWGGIAFPFNDGASAIGLQIGTFGFSDQPIYSLANPEGDGSTYNVSESFYGLSYAQNFSDRFSAGITGKVISSKLAKTSATGFAVDFGTSFHALIAEKPIRASFVIANLGTSLTHSGVGLDLAVDRPAPPLQQEVPQDPQPARYSSESFNLPVVFRVGLAYDFVSNASSRVTFMGQFEQPNNSNATGGGGLELALTDIGQSGFTVMARGSYAYQPDNNLDANPGGDAGFATTLASKDGLDGMAFGGGLMYNRGSFGLGLDYAYRHMGVLGGTHVYSATLNW